MKAIVIAEHPDIATALAAGARATADEVVAVVVGPESVPAGIADAAYHVSVPAGSVADDADVTIAPLVDGAQIVIGESSRHVKSIMGKLAAAHDASVIADVSALEDGAGEQMYFGGVGVATRKPTSTIAFFTARPSAFADASATGSNGDAEGLAWVAPAHPVTLVHAEPIEKSDVDLTKSKAVVAAGRGFAEEADLDLARQLCDKIGAGLGCTRPLAEANGWMPSETYIGVSGLNVSPAAYLAVGVSGQMQHMVGANHAGTVFAINKDESAPIFKQCDYGLVGDLKTVLPALVEAL